MSGVDDAAAAVLAALPAGLLFPAEGVIVRLNVVRGVNGSGPVVAVTTLAVRVNGVLYECGASGAFLAEISVASTATNYSGADFVGRRVKVESLGGRLLVAYTVNWSANG